MYTQPPPTHTHTRTQCNNPQTKEPKLKSAVRIVPEWTGYDQEIKALWEEHFGRKATPTQPAAAQQPSEHTNEHDTKTGHSEL